MTTVERSIGQHSSAALRAGRSLDRSPGLGRRFLLVSIALRSTLALAGTSVTLTDVLPTLLPVLAS